MPTTAYRTTSLARLARWRCGWATGVGLVRRLGGGLPRALSPLHLFGHISPFTHSRFFSPETLSRAEKTLSSLLRAWFHPRVRTTAFRTAPSLVPTTAYQTTSLARLARWRCGWAAGVGLVRRRGGGAPRALSPLHPFSHISPFTQLCPSSPAMISRAEKTLSSLLPAWFHPRVRTTAFRAAPSLPPITA